MVISFEFINFDESPKVYGYIFNNNVSVSGDFVCCARSKQTARKKLLQACREQFPVPENRDLEDIRVSWIDRRCSNAMLRNES